MEEKQIDSLDKKSKKRNWLIAISIFVFSLFYGISPVDLIPDIIPLFGWSDDALFLILSSINLYKKWKSKDT